MRLHFRFNRHAARNELQAATFNRRTAGAARLLVSPSGVMAVEVSDFRARAGKR
jgi:para-aminobenzoate synthetase/4-amino-4-deoxychorismate lyase